MADSRFRNNSDFSSYCFGPPFFSLLPFHALFFFPFFLSLKFGGGVFLLEFMCRLSFCMRLLVYESEKRNMKKMVWISDEQCV